MIFSVYLWGCSGKNGKEQLSTSFPDSIVGSELLVTVNNYPIRGHDLVTFSLVSGPIHTQVNSAREYNELLLQQLINRVLLWQEAVALGFSVSDSLVQALYLEYQRAMGGQAAISQALANVGVEKEDVIQSIQRDLIIRTFIEARFKRYAAVEEREVSEYYSLNRSRIKKPDSVRARHILLHIRVGESETAKKAKWKRIHEILEEVKAGGDFAALAQQYSEGPSNVRGGDLGYFKRGTMVAAFDSAAFALGVGEVSGVVTSQYGYHIIKVEDRKYGEVLPYAEVRDSLASVMEQDKIASLVQNHLKEMRSLAIIEENF